MCLTICLHQNGFQNLHTHTHIFSTFLFLLIKVLIVSLTSMKAIIWCIIWYDKVIQVTQRAFREIEQNKKKLAAQCHVLKTPLLASFPMPAHYHFMLFLAHCN